jgi:DNA-binding transcriptional LysR family regulator
VPKTTLNTLTSAAPVQLPSVASLLAFESVARHLHFGRAADELDVSPTAISKTIKQLEAQLGTRLFNRTTRSVALSEPGTQLLTALAPALQQIRHSVQSVSGAFRQPFGTLRINTSFVAYAALIESHLPAFLARYPEITVEISVDNRLSDIVASGFDAGIRLGHAVDRDMIAVPLGPLQRQVVVGAPAYFSHHPQPARPRDLLGHDCIRQRLASGRFFEWSFESRRQTMTIGVTGRLVFNEMRSVLDAARQGSGLAYVFEQFAAADLSSGALVKVLEKFSPPTESFYLYYPARTMMPGKLRVFLEYMRAANWVAPR